MFPETAPKKFIIWGLQMYEHTHSYIHYAFNKAALFLGWDSEWVADTVDNQIKYRDCDEYLFLTLGGYEKNIPINKNSFYILHNCEPKPYTEIPLKNKLVLQVFTNDVYERKIINLPGKKFEFWQPDINCFYMPWATDLLPYEIEDNITEKKKNFLNSDSTEIKKSLPYALFLGSVGGGIFGNTNELNNFKDGLNTENIPMYFSTETKVNQEQSIIAIKNASIAPTIVGTWQKKQGYIPCRIFKTISYGKLGITNSKQSHEVINNLTLYSQDENKLGIMASDTVINEFKYQEIILDAMKFVRDNHTYLNRIESIQFIFNCKSKMI